MKNRIRSLVAISALTGATVVGGAGLAGATSHDVEAEDPTEAAELEEVLESEDASTDAGADSRDDEVTGGDAETEEAGDVEAEGDDGDGDGDGEYRDHGARISQVAQSTEPGPGHGEAVSAVARQNGEEHRAAEADDARDASEESAEPATEETDGTEDLDTDEPTEETDDGAETEDGGADETEDAEETEDADGSTEESGEAGQARAAEARGDR